jgi:hypothetical protein
LILLIREMENQKSWIVELLTNQGIAIADINSIDFSNENIDELKNIYKSLQKWIDISDEKVSKSGVLNFENVVNVFFFIRYQSFC